MSKETIEWLNTRVLVGYTEKRGEAWHYREDTTPGAESNHYVGAIPIEDVKRRLFFWKAAEGTVETTYPAEVMGQPGVFHHRADDRKAIIRPFGTFGAEDEGAILGLFKQGFVVHDYEDWLLNNVEVLLGGDLHVGSAGLLKGGAIGWVQIEWAESIHTPQGVAFRPFLTAATSLDGSLATTYQTGSTVVVCDNTLSAALGEKNALVAKVYHSRYSAAKFDEIRDAVGIVEQVAANVEAEIKQLCEITVTDKQWSEFLVLHVFNGALPEKGRSRTLGQNKVDQLWDMWMTDERVHPWRGTAFGVLQALNTYEHHEASVRGGDRVGRNALRTVTNEWDKFDAQVVRTLEKVLI